MREEVPGGRGEDDIRGFRLVHPLRIRQNNRNLHRILVQDPGPRQQRHPHRVLTLVLLLGAEPEAHIFEL